MRPPNIVPYLKRILFAPTELSVTTLVVAIYAAVFISSILVYENVPTPPKYHHQRGLDLDQAWNDLQQITRVPHPYNSHSNGRVRDYLAHRLHAISHAHPSVQITDDRTSNGTYIGRGQVVYFEGDNLLVKIEGQDPALSAVLFSAHFDSVSTGLGATDDGMGVVTLLQLVEYYGRNKPKRTVVFNVNNGEEDWLNGAHAFLDHPWSKLPKTFLNLEGAGNGGRPMLFRSSSFDVTTAFRAVSRPHGSSLSNDAFKRGLIRSGTDFSVYEEAGMRGLDLAFYRRRARYHTVFDSTAWLGNQNSLWLMMENALEAGNALVSAGPSPKPVEVVYFDIYGSTMAVISRQGMLALNIILLILGPFFVAAVVMTSPDRHTGLINRLRENQKVWIHAPVYLVVTLAATLGLAAIFGATNKYIIYSSSYVVAASLLSIAILAVTVPAKILSYYFPSPDPLLTTVNHAVFTLFWWLLLCVATGVLNENHLGGFYYATFAYAGQLFSLLLSLGAMLHFDGDLSSSQPDGTDGENVAGDYQNGDHESADGEEPTERTSLLSDTQRLINQYLTTPALGHPNKSRSTWSAEILFSLLFPAILLSGTLIMLLTGQSQTLADGNPPMSVYLSIGFISVLLALPIAPVAHQIHRALNFFLVLVLVGTAIYNLTAFPFSPLNPLKTYVQQTIDLDSSVNKVHLTTLSSLVMGQDGRPPIWNSLPSTQKTGITCAGSWARLGLSDCKWSGLAPNVTLDSTPPSKWIKSSVTKLGFNVARFKIQGQNTRSCRIYSDVPMKSVRVVGGHWENGLEPEEEFKEIRLWSRTWDKVFDVLVAWPKNNGTTRTGKIACEWAEWDLGRIPAIDELRTFLPPWTAVSKLNDGLVEGTRAFEI
ncbi:putative zinc metalloprotease [Rhizoctonia solani 123E]|uniref:Peptide hydrolase n=1 Tax=Rhizoctonia solani 123E TaxID=1423351 RepID=A0A074RX55_9AGAM|nr:putative zinc metalloprotease [Rhizoctonia solani 123E]